MTKALRHDLIECAMMVLAVLATPSHAQTTQAPQSTGLVSAAPNSPRVDHHQHLSSPTAARVFDDADGTSIAAVPVSSEIAAMLQLRAERWNSAASLADLYTDHAIFQEERIVVGRSAVADALASRFSAPFRLVPIAVETSGPTAAVVTKLVRGARDDQPIATLSFTLTRAANGPWKIAAEQLRIPGPRRYQPLDAGDLVSMLDAAGIPRAVVLSAGYLFASPFVSIGQDVAAAVRSENDWTASQASRFPNRLVAFCSVNPLRPDAVSEIDRCAEVLKLRGLKLHFANSGVDLTRASDVVAVRNVFAAANRNKMAIVVHLWSSKRGYGAGDARIFLNEVLPAAPDVVTQVAHMAGAGPGWSDPALGVLADAVEAGDHRTSRLYFDVATVADRQSPEQLALLAKRIRQIGPGRVLYGSDAAIGGRDTPNIEWGLFRGRVPLTDEEFAAIRNNVALYLW